jgi:cell division protein FtsW (lipid II flippase)
LGKVLYHQGWNYIIVSDLLLLLSLFFIVLQVFLGGELGVSVAGFFFLPIEIGKILLTIYFADWVSRIDRGMHLGVLWIYGLVLVPFLLLIVFLKDFSPLLVFSFVFLYHIIKIKKSFLFKIILLLIIVSTLTISIASIGEYTFPFKTRPYNLILTLALLLMMGVMLLRIWMGKYARTFKLISKFIFSALLILALFSVLGAVWHSNMSVPRVLGDRIDSWLNTWQDYNLSYQFVNSLWLMKGAGLLGNPTQVMEQAVHVPLIEQDLSFRPGRYCFHFCHPGNAGFSDTPAGHPVQGWTFSMGGLCDRIPDGYFLRTVYLPGPVCGRSAAHHEPAVAISFLFQ